MSLVSNLIGGCLLALCVASPAGLAHRSLGGGGQGGRPTPAQVRRELDDARARWQASPIPHYRIRVSAFNPLRQSVAESDVRNGSVLVARQSSGMPGDRPAPGTNWGPFDGETVETLFQRIEDFLKRPGHNVGGRIVPDIVGASYDARRGYPTHIYFGPPMEAYAYDADVSIDVELIESPAVPLVAPSPGEAYKSPVPARIMDPEVRYDTMFGYGSDETARIVRRVWPDRAAEIISRGVGDYWLSVGWTPRAGLAGGIIGTLTLASGVAVYVMEFQHQGRSLYLLIDKRGVAIAKSP